MGSSGVVSSINYNNKRFYSGGEELRLSGASSKRSFVQAELRLSGASSSSKGRGDSSTVSIFVYFLTQIQAVYA